MEVSGVAALGAIGLTTNTAAIAPVNATTSVSGTLPIDSIEMSPDAMRAMESCAAPVIHDNVVVPVSTNVKSNNAIETECYVPYTQTGALARDSNLVQTIDQNIQTETVQFVEEATETLQNNIGIIFNIKSAAEQYRLLMEWLLLLLAIMLLARSI